MFGLKTRQTHSQEKKSTIFQCEAICLTAKAWLKLGHQQDNDPKHSSKSTTECLKKKTISPWWLYIFTIITCLTLLRFFLDLWYCLTRGVKTPDDQNSGEIGCVLHYRKTQCLSQSLVSVKWLFWAFVAVFLAVGRHLSVCFFSRTLVLIAFTLVWCLNRIKSYTVYAQSCALNKPIRW